jgi:hypothetical protein
MGEIASRFALPLPETGDPGRAQRDRSLRSAGA